MTTLRVAITNIPTKVGPKAWRSCFLLMSDKADIFGINEAGSARAKELYRSLAEEHGLHAYGIAGGTNPVFWNPSRYGLVSADYHRIHGKARGRKARRWPGFNGARYVNEVVLEQVDGGPDVAVLHTHWVAPGPKVRTLWRARMRRRSKAFVRELVSEHVEAGRMVLVTGDTNIRGRFWLMRGFQWVKGDGVDKVGIALPAGYALAGYGVHVYPAPTDHRHGIAVRMVVSLKEKP